MNKSSIISSDIENRLRDIQQRLVGVKLDSRTRTDLFNDLSISLNIGFVLLDEVKSLTSAPEPKSQEEMTFTNIENGKDMSFDAPVSDPKKLEAGKKAAETKKIRAGVLDNNEVHIDKNLAQRIHDKALAIGKGEASYIIVGNLRAYVGMGLLLDKIGLKSKRFYIDSVLNSFSTKYYPELKINNYDKRDFNLRCCYTHRKDNSRYNFSTEFLDNTSDDDIIVLVTGDCGKACKRELREKSCSDLACELDVYPRGWLRGKDMKEKCEEVKVMGRHYILTSEFEKNSIDDLVMKEPLGEAV